MPAGPGDPAGPARRAPTVSREVPVLVLTAFLVAAAFIGFVSLFVVGSALTDPGGWRGAALAAGYAVVVLGLAALAFLVPDTAAALIGLLSLAPVGLGAWALVDHAALRSWEDGLGPVSLVLVVVVAAGAAVLGLQHPAVGGGFLLLVTLLPTALGTAGAGAGWAPELMIAVIQLPLVAAGVLYLVAAYGATHRVARVPRAPRWQGRAPRDRFAARGSMTGRRAGA
nr:hypothetical protein [uncultured Actinotalea sp.]